MEVFIFFAFLCGAFAGVFGQFLRAFRDAGIEGEDLSVSEKFRRVSLTTHLSEKVALGVFIGGLSGLALSLESKFASEAVLNLIAAAALSYVGTDLIRLMDSLSRRFFSEPTRGAVQMAGIRLPVKFSTNLSAGNAAVCAIWIETLPVVRVTESQLVYVDVPEEMLDSSDGLRIRFEVKFPKGRAIGALAKVWQPTGIFLEQGSYRSVTGTVQANRAQSLSAAAIAPDCDVTCIPPAEQKSGPASCVVCQDQDGTFELCC